MSTLLVDKFNQILQAGVNNNILPISLKWHTFDRVLSNDSEHMV